jgi:hypothetical protein
VVLLLTVCGTSVYINMSCQCDFSYFIWWRAGGDVLPFLTLAMTVTSLYPSTTGALRATQSSVLYHSVVCYSTVSCARILASRGLFRIYSKPLLIQLQSIRMSNNPDQNMKNSVYGWVYTLKDTWDLEARGIRASGLSDCVEGSWRDWNHATKYARLASTGCRRPMISASCLFRVFK